MNPRTTTASLSRRIVTEADAYTFWKTAPLGTTPDTSGSDEPGAGKRNTGRRRLSWVFLRDQPPELASGRIW